MAEINQEQAIARYTDLMKLIQVGAYQERDHEGNYGADGIEEAADKLMFEAASHGLQFVYYNGSSTYTLEPMSQEELVTFKAAIAETPSEFASGFSEERSEHPLPESVKAWQRVSKRLRWNAMSDLAATAGASTHFMMVNLSR
jgi:hypothetical protein